MVGGAQRGRWIVAVACALAALAAGCGEEEPDPLQDEVNSGVQASLQAQGIPPDLAACLTEALEQEFPVDKLEELISEAQENPFEAFGPDEQEAVLRISESCGGPAALLGAGSGGGSGSPSPPAGGDSQEAYFDCVAAAGSSEAVKGCEENLP